MVIAFLFAGIMATETNAQPRHGFAGWSLLDLTDEQEEELTSLRLEHYKEVKPLRSKMIELKARERTLLAEDNVDMKALNNVIDEQTDLNNKIRKLRAEHRVQVRSQLTDEQRMILDQRRSNRYLGKGRGFAGPRGMQGRRGGFGPRGDGYGRWGDGSGRWGDGSGRWGDGSGGRGLGPCGQGLGPRGW